MHEMVTSVKFAPETRCVNTGWTFNFRLLRSLGSLKGDRTWFYLSQGGVNRGKQIRRSVPNSMQIRQSVKNPLSNPSIHDYFCSNPYTPKFGESQKQNWPQLQAYFVSKLEYGKRTGASFWIGTQFKTALELWRNSQKSDRYCYSIKVYGCNCIKTFKNK